MNLVKKSLALLAFTFALTLILAGYGYVNGDDSALAASAGIFVGGAAFSFIGVGVGLLRAE